MNPFYELRADDSITHLYRHENFGFPSHFHTEIEITYCISGRQDIKIGNICYSLSAGDAVVIFPNMIHEFIDSKNEIEPESITLICSPDLIWQNMPKIKGMIPETPLIKSENISSETAASFSKIINGHDNLFKLGHTYIILSDLINSLNLRKINYQDDMNIAQKITEYITTHFSEPVTLELLCKKLNVSASYLSHVFSEQFKVPFRTYLGAVRAEHSASLIRTTDKNFTEIAYESGFESQRTFNRAFKSHFDMTPSEYKKNFR